VDVAARQHVGELVADQFADPKLALRAASGLLAMVVTWHFLTKFSFVMPGHSRSKNGVASLAYVPGIHVLKCHLQSRRGWPGQTRP
jgi:hypothetical protein